MVGLPNWLSGAPTMCDQNVIASDAAADSWIWSRKMSRSDETPTRRSHARNRRIIAGSEFMN
jgi:hypothetical protein